MEEHCEAYFAWKQAGLRGAWCWHVDAHLDIGRDGLDEATLQALADCSTYEQAQQRGLCGDPFVPWGGLNCGNYLYAAIRHGMVGRLTWVIPPDLPVGGMLSWARQHLNGWFDLRISESVELKEQNGHVSGTILGIPFSVGTAAALPVPTEPVLLDVDLDYFLTTRGELWAESADFPPSRFTTVAYSVKGGYLSEEYRRLAGAWVQDVSGYSPDDVDRAAGLMRLQRYDEALPLLAGQTSAAAAYLRGTCYYHQARHDLALATWREMLGRSDLPPAARAYVGGLASEALCHLERPREALEYAQAAQTHVEPDYRLLWATAGAYEKLGELRKATQMIRRALPLAESYVFSLQMRLALARLYKMQDKHGLASLELAELAKADLGGELRPLTLLR